MSASPDQIRSTADSYIAALTAGDLEAVMNLYAEGATVEDPVGNGTVHEGKVAIREFYATTLA